MGSGQNVFAITDKCATLKICTPKTAPKSQFLTPITVKYISIRIVNDHDGFFQGDGEIFLNAKVNGREIQLLNSYEDLGDGSNYNFNNKKVTVMVSPGGKLDLTTSGCESDKNQKLG
jgi:hypothetical protein